jgi:hypothetical protein
MRQRSENTKGLARSLLTSNSRTKPLMMRSGAFSTRRLLRAGSGVAIVAVAVAHVACGSSLSEPNYAPQPPSSFVAVGFSPPPARVEIVPARPQPGVVWVDGEWSWDASRWAWEPGRWVMAPMRARFAKWASIRRRDGTLLVAPGTWRNGDGREVPAPPALATARAGSGSVWDAEGQRENTAPNVLPSGGERQTPR